MKAFTYWEGPEQPLFSKLCVESVAREFKTDHIHLCPENIFQYIDKKDVPLAILESKHYGFKACFYRTLLLKKYGGWWFDCDVFLFENPSSLVSGQPMVWKEHKPEEKRLAVGCGILYSPRPRELFFEKWEQGLLSWQLQGDGISDGVWTQGQSIFIDIAENQTDESLIVIGDVDVFMPFHPDREWDILWTGEYKRQAKSFGVQFYGAVLRRGGLGVNTELAKTILSLSDKKELIARFPNGVLAEHYAKEQELVVI